MTWTIAYDPERMVCGCVILQVGMGATVPHERIAGLPWVRGLRPGRRGCVCFRSTRTAWRSFRGSTTRGGDAP